MIYNNLSTTGICLLCLLVLVSLWINEMYFVQCVFVSWWVVSHIALDFHNNSPTFSQSAAVRRSRAGVRLAPHGCDLAQFSTIFQDTCITVKNKVKSNLTRWDHSNTKERDKYRNKVKTEPVTLLDLCSLSRMFLVIHQLFLNIKLLMPRSPSSFFSTSAPSRRAGIGWSFWLHSMLLWRCRITFVLLVIRTWHVAPLSLTLPSRFFSSLVRESNFDLWHYI